MAAEWKLAQRTLRRLDVRVYPVLVWISDGPMRWAGRNAWYYGSDAWGFWFNFFTSPWVPSVYDLMLESWFGT